MRPFAALACVAAVLHGSAVAQPTFSTITVWDSVPSDLPPLPENIGAAHSVLVARCALAPSARARLRRHVGLDYSFTTAPAAPGPVILTAQKFLRIPGDPRLRVEGESRAVHVLGLGATAEETLRAARDEPFPRALLIGAHPAAVPAHGFVRIGDAKARPVLWGRQLSIHGDRAVPRGRTIGVMDDYSSQGHPLSIACGGSYPQHLQGVCSGRDRSLYWSWTDRIVRTDAAGKPLAQAEAPSHQGDLTWHDGKLVVAVNLGLFNDPEERHDSWAYVYDGKTLELIGKHRLPEVRYGAGGICWAGDRYVVVGGLPDPVKGEPGSSNEVHEYDAAFRHRRTVTLPGGWTKLGIQTAELALGRLWFGCYGEPRVLLVASPDLAHVQRYDGVDAAYGIVSRPGGALFVARDTSAKGKHSGAVVFALPVPQVGLTAFGR